MKIGIIGRHQNLFYTMDLLHKLNYEIGFIVTSRSPSDYKINHDEFKKFAMKNSIPFLFQSKKNEQELSDFIARNSVDIGISVNFPYILGRNIINLFPKGIINAHGGDLPRYRGNACQAWAILNREKQIGITIHLMEAGHVDSGDIILKKYIDIDMNTRISNVYSAFEEIIPSAFVEAITFLESGKDLIKQSSLTAKPLRCYPRIYEDCKINWNLEAEDILRLINVSSEPYSGAFTFLDNKKIIIWRACIEDTSYDILSGCGHICELHQNGDISVMAADKLLRVTEIEVDNMRVKPREIIKSIRKRFSNE